MAETLSVAAVNGAWKPNGIGAGLDGIVGNIAFDNPEKHHLPDPLYLVYPLA